MWKVEPPDRTSSEAVNRIDRVDGPRMEGVQTAVTTDRSASEPDRPKVMVVDDDEDLLSLMQRSLEKGGFTVIPRSSPPDQRELQRIAPSVLFMDVDLIDANGADACHSIKEDNSIAHVPVILISAQEEDRLRSTARTCRANGFLTKPFKKGVMVDVAWSYASARRGSLGA